jgi:hypothetical protein
MMKRGLLFLLVLMALGPAPAIRAQTHVDTLASLRIAFWPDYDRPSVLVILTGSVQSGAPLPAVVKLPIPADATMNAVARIDAGGKMMADIVYTLDAGQLTLNTPDPNFRVEYYVPHQVEGDNRSFSFTWRADLSVGALEAVVQRPAAASSLVIEPMAAGVNRGMDGLEYHVLAAQTVPAGETFDLKAAYPNVTAPLSLETLRTQFAHPPGAPGSPPPASATRTPAPPPASVTRTPAPVSPAASGGTRWGLVLVAIASAGLATALTWQIAKSRFRAAGDEDVPPQAEELFDSCPECGRRNEAGDRFCSRCGGTLLAKD